MSDLFHTFEQKVPMCSACYVDVSNISQLAEYFAYGTGYEVTVVRSPEKISLTISKDDTSITVLPGQMLIYGGGGQPPTVMSREEFNKLWRHERAEDRLCNQAIAGVLDRLQRTEAAAP